MSGDHVRAVREALSDPLDVCARLGLLERAQRSGRNVLICCPAHEDSRPSCSVFIADDRTVGVLCRSCTFAGDVFHLIGAARKIGFREALEHGAALAGLSLDAPLPPPRALPPLPPRRPPPIEEVRRVLSAGLAPWTDPVVAAWLRSRALDPYACRDLCVAIGRYEPPWARRKGDRPAAVPWSVTGHRLLLRAYNTLGELVSVRARAVVPTDDPKSLPPSGHSSAGLVLANRAAVELLRSAPGLPDVPRLLADAPSGPGARKRYHVVIAEGEPDFKGWASRLIRRGENVTWAVLGLPGSGAWSPALAARIPSGSLVVVRTHPDDAGDLYLDDVVRDLGDRCDVLTTDSAGRRRRGAKREWERSRGRAPRSGEKKGPDDNDLLRRGELPDDPREGTEVWDG